MRRLTSKMLFKIINNTKYTIPNIDDLSLSDKYVKSKFPKAELNKVPSASQNVLYELVEVNNKFPIVAKTTSCNENKTMKIVISAIIF